MRLQHYDVAQLIKEFVTTIKYTDGSKNDYWIYNRIDKIWIYSTQPSTFFCEMVKILGAISLKALQKEKITDVQYDTINQRRFQGNFWTNVVKFFDIRPDRQFEVALDMNHPYLPLRGGKCINMKTLQIRNRSKHDYWSYELKSEFMPDLDDNDNEFAKFLHQLFDVEEEYKHFRLILGYIMTNQINQDMFLVVSSTHGGSGKTTLFEIIKKAFPEFWCTIHKDIIINGKGNYSAEMCKANKKRMLIMDEGAPNQKTNITYFRH